MKRKRLQADYVRQTEENGKTSYVYMGPKFSLVVTQEERRRYIVTCWLAPALSFLVFVFMGLLNTVGTRVPYVALPYVGIFLPVMILFGNAYKVTVARAEMQRAEYERGILQMRSYTIVGLVFSGATLLGQTALLIFGNTVETMVEWGFWTCAMVLCMIFCAFLQIQRHIRVQIR